LGLVIPRPVASMAELLGQPISDEWFDEKITLSPVPHVPLIVLLKALLHECEEHNHEYHHHTSDSLLLKTRQVIEELENNNG